MRSLLGVLSLLVLLFYVFAPHVNAWKLEQAERAKSNPAEALRYVDEVLARDPDNIAALGMRIDMLMRLGDTQAAIRATNDALEIELLPTESRRNLLGVRAELQQRLGQHREAMRDASAMLASSQNSAPASQRGKLRALMEPRNANAYVVARAAAAGQADRAQIAAAQRDMQLVFAGLEQLRLDHMDPDEPPQHPLWRLIFGPPRRDPPPSEITQFKYLQLEASYLDTSAYLEMSAGNLLVAMRDVTRALQLCETLELMVPRIAQQISPDSRKELQQMLQRTRAVVLHHRGEVLLAMGNRREGQYSIQVALRQGYSRDKGNW